MSSTRWLGAAVLAGLTVVAVGIGRGGGLEPAIRTIQIDIHYSHFAPAALTVPAGVRIRFVIVNGDPIGHEWIVGDEALHARHRNGTETHHGDRPTEQSIAAGQTVETVVTFVTPGTLTYVCHLPGHEAYGMLGTLRVVGGG
ncbi:MAG: plastocyanin/azurin family copper-binding protein [Candidatus Limnocylindrales bacterium]